MRQKPDDRRRLRIHEKRSDINTSRVCNLLVSAYKCYESTIKDVKQDSFVLSLSLSLSLSLCSPAPLAPPLLLPSSPLFSSLLLSSSLFSSLLLSSLLFSSPRLSSLLSSRLVALFLSSPFFLFSFSISFSFWFLSTFSIFLFYIPGIGTQKMIFVL